MTMANINPDPHEYGYVFIPLNRITSLFASRDDARAAVNEVCSIGFLPQNIDVFVGSEGAATLDLSGAAHGAAIRRVRDFEAFMVGAAGDAHQRADTALKAGGVAIAILMDGNEARKTDLAALLRRHHATVVRYWGRWTIESLD
jgi:hypothetical protein